jgi:hypothetical protein
MREIDDIKTLLKIVSNHFNDIWTGNLRNLGSDELFYYSNSDVLV